MKDTKPEGWGDLIEKLADIEHQRWADWHRWAKLGWTESNVARWDKQADTPYSKLSEQEKESDREQVRRYLPLISEVITAEKQKMIYEIDERLDRGDSWSHGIRDDLLTTLHNDK